MVEQLPQKLFINIVLMTVVGIQPKTTDRPNPTSLVYLGTAPPECVVLELWLHYAPAWAALLFCIKLKH